MFGVTKQLIEGLFEAAGREAPTVLQVKPHDLRGPHPRRLKPYRFVFRFDGQEELAVDIPLIPPRLWRRIDPRVDPTCGRWTESDAKPGLVVDQSMLGFPDKNASDFTRIPDERGSYVLDDGSFDWLIAGCALLILPLKAVFAEFEVFIEVGSYNFDVPGDAEFNYLSREAWLRQMEKANAYYANITHLGPAGPNGERISEHWVMPGWPLHPAPGILNLHGAWGQRFRSRPLGDDEEWEWSRDRKLKATAREIDCTVIPLSRNRALILRFEMSAGSPPKRWRSRGVEVIEAILQGMRFHGPWPAFEDVPTGGESPK